MQSLSRMLQNQQHTMQDLLAEQMLRSLLYMLQSVEDSNRSAQNMTGEIVTAVMYRAQGCECRIITNDPQKEMYMAASIMLRSMVYGSAP